MLKKILKHSSPVRLILEKGICNLIDQFPSLNDINSPTYVPPPLEMQIIHDDETIIKSVMSVVYTILKKIIKGIQVSKSRARKL